MGQINKKRPRQQISTTTSTCASLSSKSSSQKHEKNSIAANNNNNNNTMITPTVVSPITGGVQTVVATANSHNSVVVDGPLTAQQRREALKLSFQRSFSEPLGGVAGRVLGVPNTPTLESPPSVSPSLHPSQVSIKQRESHQVAFATPVH